MAKNVLINWPLGDQDTNITVSASEALLVGPVQMNIYNVSTAILTCERTSGTGVVTVSGQMSDDGITFGSSFSLLTTVVGTPQTVTLDSLDPGKYISLTFTETGESASWVGYCRLDGTGIF